jgi:hypothetical protein
MQLLQDLIIDAKTDRTPHIASSAFQVVLNSTLIKIKPTRYFLVLKSLQEIFEDAVNKTQRNLAAAIDQDKDLLEYLTQEKESSQ